MAHVFILSLDDLLTYSSHQNWAQQWKFDRTFQSYSGYVSMIQNWKHCLKTSDNEKKKCLI